MASPSDLGVGPTLKPRKGRSRRQPRTRALVRLRSPLPSRRNGAPSLKAGVAYVFLGEIPNMPGHCVVADAKTGQLITGYHTDNFVEIPEDEV